MSEHPPSEQPPSGRPSNGLASSEQPPAYEQQRLTQHPAANQPPSGQQQPQQQWAWVRPAAQPQWVQTEPLEYHQLWRGAPRYRWWKPLLALVLGVIYYLTFSVAFGFAVMLPYFAFSGEPLTEGAMFALATPDTQNPTSLVMTLGSVILMIPAAILAVLSVGLSPVGRLWSAALRIRWRLIGRTILPALIALIVMNGAGIMLELVISAIVGDDASTPPPVDLEMTVVLWSAIILLLLVPVQSAAEELVFRGMFMQTLGAWFGGFGKGTAFGRFMRGPWLVIAIPAIAFGFSHIYDIWGWCAVVAMALVAGWVSWRTGGLEAAISLHAVNNLVAFGFLLFAFGGETGQTADGGGPGSLIGSILGLALYAWWVNRDFKRHDGVRTRIDAIEVRSGFAPSASAPGAAVLHAAAPMDSVPADSAPSASEPTPPAPSATADTAERENHSGDDQGQTRA